MYFVLITKCDKDLLILQDTSIFKKDHLSHTQISFEEAQLCTNYRCSSLLQNRGVVSFLPRVVAVVTKVHLALCWSPLSPRHPISSSALFALWPSLSLGNPRRFTWSLAPAWLLGSTSNRESQTTSFTLPPYGRGSTALSPNLLLE